MNRLFSPDTALSPLGFLSRLVFCWCLMIPHGAWADEPSSGLDGIRKQMERGQALFLAKDYEQAAHVFEKGFERYPYSAFLFNAGVCYQRLGQKEKALSAFERYLQKDPDAPDAPSVKKRMQELAEGASEEEGEASIDSSSDASTADDQATMKSLVVIETDPEAAPILVYHFQGSEPEIERDGTVEEAPPKPSYEPGSPDWKLVAESAAPVNLTLAVGRYHIVVEEFREFNRSETDIVVSPGHVHHFRANLSQGEFLGALAVTSNVEGAKIFVDVGDEEKTVWGTAPHSALIAPGPHQVILEAPGYQLFSQRVEVTAGQSAELKAQMERVDFGVVRVDADVAEILVSIDQKAVGSWRQGEAALEITLESGAHEVLIRSKGYKDLRKQITVPKGQLVPMRAKMVEKYPRGAAWTQAILAAGFLGTGIYLGVESNRLNRELSEDRAAGYLHASDPDIKKGFWFSIGADSAFAVSGVLAALSTFNFIRDPYPDPVLYRGKTREFERIRRDDPVLESPGRSGLQHGPRSHRTTTVNRASVIYCGVMEPAPAGKGAL